ncbi:MAG: protein kinase [Planctomycetes bacterium]|nr:protein kinase [Planctomycetota bacterium]
MSVSIPEPFLSALGQGRPGDVGDADAATPEARYGRALARLQVGRDRDARSDLEAALPALGDACRIEIAYLDMRERASVEDALACCEEVLRAAPAGTALRARALHVGGLAKAKLRRLEEATDALVEACSVYRSLGDRAGAAQAQDTLGTLHSSRGRLDLALSAYAVSFAEKALAGDRYGMAITLGNLGRVLSKAGRYQDALRCFELDLSLASELGDRRGRARMLNDMGRVRLAMEDLDLAEADLRACLAAALEAGYRDIEVFARKDLAALSIARGRLDDAEGEISLAEEALAEGAEPYLRALLLAARGEVALARKDPGALALLEEAARMFAEGDLPDHEIPLRISLARAYAAAKLKRQAEACLERVLDAARRGGFERYLRRIREEMAELGWTEGLVEEKGRLPIPSRSEPLPGGYVILERLGGGAFGEVFRAYDPARDQIVALKRVYLGKVYNLEKRESLIASARIELAAASRVRHPGVARVYAVGHDEGGDAYVVQELVQGRSLRAFMDASRAQPADQGLVARKVQLIAAALQALHSSGVVHRDLKPENILLRAPDDSPVLVDFGIAHVGGAEGLGLAGLGGTFPYIGPEAFRGARITAKGDMYSLGVLVYEWLAGRLPYDMEGKGWDEAVRDKLGGPPLPLPPGLPGGLVGLVEALMDPEPARRPDAEEVESLCAVLGAGDSAVGHARPPPGFSSDTTLPPVGEVGSELRE